MPCRVSVYFVSPTCYACAYVMNALCNPRILFVIMVIAAYARRTCIHDIIAIVLITSLLSVFQVTHSIDTRHQSMSHMHFMLQVLHLRILYSHYVCHKTLSRHETTAVSEDERFFMLCTKLSASCLHHTKKVLYLFIHCYQFLFYRASKLMILVTDEYRFTYYCKPVHLT